MRVGHDLPRTLVLSYAAWTYAAVRPARAASQRRRAVADPWRITAPLGGAWRRLQSGAERSDGAGTSAGRRLRGLVRGLLRAGGQPQKRIGGPASGREGARRSEEHTSELQSLMRISYSVFCFNTHL